MNLRYVYDVGPIDDFTGFEIPTVKNCEHYNKLLVQARQLLIKHTYWEGDGTFLIFPILNIHDMCFPHVAWAIKQSNNGSTFIISPVLLNGFDEYLEGELVFDEVPW